MFTSIFVNIGFLFVFKYYNFFAESFSQAFQFFGTQINPDRLNFILPVGISFYTFQTLSYTIDVYNKKLKPTNRIISFFLAECGFTTTFFFTSFFMLQYRTIALKTLASLFRGESDS